MDSRRAGFFTAASLALLLLAGCEGSSGGGGGGSTAEGTTTPTYSLPAYTIAATPVQAPTTNADGSVRFYDHTHIQLAQTIAVTTTVIRMTVTGIFHASVVYPIILASSLASGSTNGWVLKFDRGLPGATNLQFQPCITENCTNSATEAAYTFSNAYAVGDAFTLTVEVDCGGNDIVRVWADTAYGGAANQTYTTLLNSATGNLLGMSIVGATIRSIQVVQQ